MSETQRERRGRGRRPEADVLADILGAAGELLLSGRLTVAAARDAGEAAFGRARAREDNAYKLELGARTVADALMIAAERSRS